MLTIYQDIPSKKLNVMVKPWLFEGWAMDITSKIHSPSSRGHNYTLVALFYFTKWVEATLY
jgi:hypothetical protein